MQRGDIQLICSVYFRLWLERRPSNLHNPAGKSTTRNWRGRFRLLTLKPQDRRLRDAASDQIFSDCRREMLSKISRRPAIFTFRSCATNVFDRKLASFPILFTGLFCGGNVGNIRLVGNFEPRSQLGHLCRECIDLIRRLSRDRCLVRSGHRANVHELFFLQHLHKEDNFRRFVIDDQYLGLGNSPLVQTHATSPRAPDCPDNIPAGIETVNRV